MFDSHDDVRDRLHREGAFNLDTSSSWDEDSFTVLLGIVLFLVVTLPMSVMLMKHIGTSFIFSEIISIVMLVFSYKLFKKITKAKAS